MTDILEIEESYDLTKTAVCLCGFKRELRH